MANFIGTSGTDSFTGGTEADDFYFTSGDLSADDTIVGGVGGTDRLVILGGGLVDITGSGVFGATGSIQGIDQIVLVDNPVGTTIRVNVINNAGGVLAVYCGNGNDSVMVLGEWTGTVQTGVMHLFGGAGDDLLRSDLGKLDLLYGGEGNDIFIGASCYMFGGNGNDHFNAEHNSTVSGGDGDDIITVGGLYVNIDGGTGFDTVTFVQSSNNISVQNVEAINFPAFFSTTLNLTVPLAQLSAITFSGTLGMGSSLIFKLTGDGSYSFPILGILGKPVDVTLIGQTAGVYLSGTNLGDFLRGSDHGDILYGAGGFDTIYGGYGSDYIFGEAGIDTLYGYVGSDALFGGQGDDTIITAAYYHGNPELGGTSYASGGDGNDMLFANGLKDVLLGDAGDDYLFSYSDENVYLYGGDGGDYINGSGGNDYLNGGAGNDVLRGYSGLDYFYGGAGSDYFVMDTDDWYGGHDVIADFQAGTDYIGLEGYWKTKGAFFDTAAGVCIYYADATGTYMIFVTSTHDVSAVKNAVYYTDL